MFFNFHTITKNNQICFGIYIIYLFILTFDNAYSPKDNSIKNICSRLEFSKVCCNVILSKRY